MNSRPTAIGYLLSDVSGIQQAWDEAQIRSLAARLGYDLAKIVAFSKRTGNPIGLLKTQAALDNAEAVLTPSLRHFESGMPPTELVEQVDLITVDPHDTYARWAIPPVGYAGE
ncbi:hypothetical protein [Nocardia sp. NPDC057668]|uniref:hypothetical protein n=1 Tax=Nocardia sp. NPDC057668 TaxID=3346202 RepID=UPI00366BDB7C